MFCQHCKSRIATHHTTQLIGNKYCESHLCDFCYASVYSELENNISTGILAGLFGAKKEEGKRCRVCGTSFSDYRKSGLLGCASCYDVFKAELIPEIIKIQGKIEHVGKKGEDSSRQDLYRELSILQDELERYLRNKNFSLASACNEKIKKINTMLYGKEQGEHGMD